MKETENSPSIPKAFLIALLLLAMLAAVLLLSAPSTAFIYIDF